MHKYVITENLPKPLQLINNVMTYDVKHKYKVVVVLKNN